MSLPKGVFVVAWTYAGPANSEFAVVIGEPSAKTFINFVNGMGPMSGSHELELTAGANDLVLSVEAFGLWQVTIRPKTG